MELTDKKFSWQSVTKHYLHQTRPNITRSNLVSDKNFLRWQETINNRILNHSFDTGILSENTLLHESNFFQHPLRSFVLNINKSLQPQQIGKVLEDLRHSNLEYFCGYPLAPVASPNGITYVSLVSFLTWPRIHWNKADGTVVKANWTTPWMRYANIPYEGQSLLLGSTRFPSEVSCHFIIPCPQEKIINITHLEWPESNGGQIHWCHLGQTMCCSDFWSFRYWFTQKK